MVSVIAVKPIAYKTCKIMSFKNNVQFIILIKAKIIFYFKKMPEIVLNTLSTSKLYIITLRLFLCTK